MFIINVIETLEFYFKDLGIRLIVLLNYLYDMYATFNFIQQSFSHSLYGQNIIFLFE